jgi:hypothetical protein
VITHQKFQAALDQLGLSINDVARMFGINRLSVKRWFDEDIPRHRAIVIYLMKIIDDEMNFENGDPFSISRAVEDAIKEWMKGNGRDNRH